MMKIIVQRATLQLLISLVQPMLTSRQMLTAKPTILLDSF